MAEWQDKEIRSLQIEPEPDEAEDQSCRLQKGIRIVGRREDRGGADHSIYFSVKKLGEPAIEEWLEGILLQKRPHQIDRKIGDDSIGEMQALVINAKSEQYDY